MSVELSSLDLWEIEDVSEKRTHRSGLPPVNYVGLTAKRQKMFP